MDLFSISELAKYSGIKPHTIRIWEKRYKALKPNRSLGNTRYYDNSQLRRLLNITGLLDSDHKVSELCVMPDAKLEAMHWERRFSPAAESSEYFVSQLIAATISYDEVHFVNIFSHCLLRYGMKDTYLKVLYPMLLRIGLMWLNDTLPSANEHFASNLIRQKLFTAIDSLPPPKSTASSWLLFLPQNEFHEIGLLMSYYLIRLSGRKVIYLGSNVPDSSLKNAVKEIKPEHLLLFFVHQNLTEDTQKYLDHLNSGLNVKKIYVAANPILTNKIKPGRKINFLGSAQDLDKLLSFIDV